MDIDLRHQVLKAAVRDRLFLKSVAVDVVAADFPEKIEQIIADIAIRFWDQHGEPVGALLRSDAEDEARRLRLPMETRKKLNDLVTKLQNGHMELVPVRALEDRVRAIKRDRFFDGALEKIVTAQEKNTLTTDTLATIVEDAQRELSDRLYLSDDYLDSLEKRIERRASHNESDKYPLLLIDPIDDKIHAIARGEFGIFVGPMNSGKSMFLLHVALAYALQGLNVIYVTLEDPKDLVDARMDACITGIPMAKLRQLPNRLKRKFEEMRQLIRGRIKLIDATEGGFTISAAEKIFMQERAGGFTADAFIIDYDEEIECEEKFTGEMFRKRQFESTYKRFRRFAKKYELLGWTAAQTKAAGLHKRIISAAEIGEDYSKAKRAFLAIGIGSDPDVEKAKHLYVMRHRTDRSKFGVDILTDFESGIAYDREATMRIYKRPRR